MLPLIGIPATVARFLKPYRQTFRKEAGFQHLSRYMNGRRMSPNKTLPGIYSQIGWESQSPESRRAMHEAVFETRWKHQDLMKQHRQVIFQAHRGKGREMIALD